LLTVFLAALTTAAPGQSPNVPVFWSDKEQLSAPDLTSRERIRFLTTTDFPPFNFLDDNGRLSGFHVDLARAICKELKVADRCQIQALPWSELDAALAEGEGEAIIAGVAITAESRAKYAFTRPYLRFPARFVARRSSSLDEPLHEGLKDRRVGVNAGSAHERMLRALFPDARVVTFSRQEWIFDDLATGKIDAAFGDGMRLGFWLSGGQGGCCKFIGGPYMAQEYLGQGLAVAVRPEDADLVQAFDYALREIGVKGVFAELYLRYFPVGFF
jgi:polar amino acid transport system substrate-binding protein